MDDLNRQTERNRTLLEKLRPYFTRRAISLLLVIVGLGLLGYVASEYWGMYRSQQKLEAEWERQAASVSTPGTANISPDQMLTRVIIPKIGMDAIVVEGASRKELSEGPGHMKQTAMPGEIGNAVITAHRDTFFRHIYELTKGDEIQVRRSGRTYAFQVTGKKIVQPDDLSVVKNTPDTRLTLITCYPIYYIGPAPERLVVFSTLVGASPQQAQTPRGNPRQGS